VLFTQHCLVVNFAINQPREIEAQETSPPAGSASLGKVPMWEFSVQARYIGKIYPAMSFDIGEPELSRELEIYYQAIHSYPDHFARTHVTFQRHLLNMMGVVQSSGSSGSECLKSAS